MMNKIAIVTLSVILAIGGLVSCRGDYEIESVESIADSPPPTFEEMQAEKISRAIDSQNPTTRNYAVQLAALFPGEYNIGQIGGIYDYLYANWRYVSDPRGVDYYASASESINNGLVGDCDDFAITIAALIEAIGGASRVLVAYGPEDAHAYAEVFVGEESLEYLAGKYQEVIWSRHDGQGGAWLNLDWSARHPGGPYFERESLIIVYPNGRWEQYGEP